MPGGLVFGYGAIREAAIDDGLARLAAVIARIRDSKDRPEKFGAAPEGAAPLLSR
jgi:hypothetical protein